MKYATHEQATEYFNEASDFVDNTKAPFSDVRTVVRRGIAEYLANKDGITLFEPVAE